MILSLITHQANDFLKLLYSLRKEDISIVEDIQEENERLTFKVHREEKVAEQPRRRDRHDIIAEILKTAMGGKKKTFIMYKARLSHSQLKLYLDLLNQRGMIVHNDGMYKTTPKGLTFIRRFESIDFLFRH